jgi:hypothetical protein
MSSIIAGDQCVGVMRLQYLGSNGMPERLCSWSMQSVLGVTRSEGAMTCPEAAESSVFMQRDASRGPERLRDRERSTRSQSRKVAGAKGKGVMEERLDEVALGQRSG